MQQDALLAIVTDDEGDNLYDPSTLLQGRFGLYSICRNGLEFEGRRRYFLTINEQLIGAVSLLQRQWMSKKCHKNFIKLKKAVVILQARGRRLYFWGVTDECSDTVLKVLEVRKIITSIKHALSIVRYLEFLVENPVLLDIVYNC